MHDVGVDEKGGRDGRKGAWKEGEGEREGYPAE
jgi:hypothetical protein